MKIVWTLIALVVLAVIAMLPRWRVDQFDAWCKEHHYDGACGNCQTPEGDPNAACLRWRMNASGKQAADIVGRDEVLAIERRRKTESAAHRL